MLVSTMGVSVCLSFINKKIKMCQGVEVLRCHGVGINNGCVCVSVCLSFINKKIKMCQGLEVLRCHGVAINNVVVVVVVDRFIIFFVTICLVYNK